MGLTIEPALLDFADVMIIPQRTTIASRKEVSVTERYEFDNGVYFEGSPIMNSNMDHTGTFEMSRELQRCGLMSCIHKHYSAFELIEFFSTVKRNSGVFYSMGMTDDDQNRFEIVYNSLNADHKIEFVCLDVANGYMLSFVDFVAKFHEKYPNVVIMAGNVVTADGALSLARAGAQIIKLGIGSGSCCTTRKMTGVGYPQLAAIIDCVPHLHAYVCSDGGISEIGDIAKALGAGADFVMCGGLFAGHEECAGVVRSATNTVRFYGMSSNEALNKYHDGKATHRAAEGKSVDIPFKGKVEYTIQEMLGGLRSACSYVGALKASDLYFLVRFAEVRHQLNNSLSEYNT